MSVSTEEAWIVEPELKDRPPRRVAAADRIDYNKPSTQVLTAASGAVIVTGLVLFVAGLVMKQSMLTIALGHASKISCISGIGSWPLMRNSFTSS